MTEQLDRRAFAQRLGVDPQTVTRGVREGRYPQPDGHVGNHPWWWESTVAAFDRPKAGRPRQTNRRGDPMTMSEIPESVRVQTIKPGVYHLGGGRMVRVDVAEGGGRTFLRAVDGSLVPIDGDERARLIDILAVPAVW